MFLGPGQVERVKSAVDLARVLDRYVEGGVHKAGAHLKARCPFHVERSPSLVVYDDGCYHCFGCGAHGDAITLLQEKDGLDFQTAVARLAAEFSVPLEDKATNAAPPGETEPLFYACEFAANFYEQALWSSGGEDALSYLRSRRFADATLRVHRVGFAPGYSALCAAAGAAGIDRQALLDADLAKVVDGRLVDRFYRRVVVPITTSGGRVCAFTCRGLPADEISAKERGHDFAKYVNSGETRIFRKGAVVFNLHRGGAAGRKSGRLLVMEGALDVIAADQGKQAACVAPLGTGFTADHAAAIRRALPDAPVYLVFDGDQAGRQATCRAASLLISAGAAVRIVTLPERIDPTTGKPAKVDPAELLVEDASPENTEAFDAALAQAASGVPWLTTFLCPNPAQLDPSGQLAIFDKLLDVLQKIPDAELRDLHVNSVAAALGIARPLAKRRLANRLDSHSSVPGEPPRGAGGIPSTTARWQPKYDRNETGNAHRFRDIHGKDVRFVHTWDQWLVWRGSHWEVDPDCEVERRMVQAIDRTCCDEIGEIEHLLKTTAESDTKHRDWLEWQRDQVEQWRTKNLNERAIQHSIARARSLAELAITASRLDTDIWSFTVLNGTIDLRTGVLRDHNRDDYITRLCPVAFDPAATDARWSAFLDDFTARDPELIAYLQRVAGYVMSGDTRREACWMFSGPGGGGKSTFTSTIAAVIGSYARAVPFETFLSSQSEKPKWVLAEISQMRLIICEESEEGKRFNASLVKLVTGRSEIDAQAKGKQPFTYLPLFKTVFVTNDPPYVSDKDDGFWRRMRLIRCEHIPAQRDEDLKDHLRSPAARAAILAWMVAGARSYDQQGLAEPECVRANSAGYRDEQDPLRDFLTDCTWWGPEGQEGTVTNHALRALYETWCLENGVKHPVSAKGFAQRLQALGASRASVYDASKGRSVRGWHGLRERFDTDKHDVGAPPLPLGLAGRLAQTTPVQATTRISPHIASLCPTAPASEASTDAQQSLLKHLGASPPPSVALPLASDQPTATASGSICDDKWSDTDPTHDTDLHRLDTDAQDKSVRTHEGYNSPGSSSLQGGSVGESSASKPSLTDLQALAVRVGLAPDPARIFAGVWHDHPAGLDPTLVAHEPTAWLLQAGLIVASPHGLTLTERGQGLADFALAMAPTRGARAASPPSPAEDLFAPPPREPGDDEDEPPPMDPQP